MKFCCERFQNYYDRPKTRGPNIRIVKYSADQLLDTTYRYRFYIAYDYTDEARLVPNMNIAYCPFCGTHLFEFYRDDKYVNEQPGFF
jgi:hypothetical protein